MNQLLVILEIELLWLISSPPLYILLLLQSLPCAVDLQRVRGSCGHAPAATRIRNDWRCPGAAGSRKAKPISDVCNPGFSIDPFMHCIAEPRPSPTSITPRWKTHAPTLHHEPPSPHLLKASLQRPNPRVSISSPHKEPQRSLNLPTEQAHISTTPT